MFMTNSNKYFNFSKNGEFRVETASEDQVFDFGQLKLQYRKTPNLGQYKNGFSLLGVNTFMNQKGASFTDNEFNFCIPVDSSDENPVFCANNTTQAAKISETKNS